MRHFPEETCKRCPSYLICLTMGNGGGDITEECYVKKCIGCEKTVLFYFSLGRKYSSTTVMSRIFFGDVEGGRVLRGCLLGEQEDFDFQCRECKRRIVKEYLAGR